jgi:glycosyltransferase involved in cell wall biosynthesis
MTADERVSCIIPVFNGARYLAESIHSALSQSRSIDEVIVVDDGSTDNTFSVVAEFGGAVRYVRQDNAGPAAARNRGVGLTNAEFITFLDADDLWHPEKTAVQLAAFADDPELLVCVAHVENFASPDVPAERQLPTFEARAKPVAGYVTPCLMARRAAFDTIGLFDATLMHADSQHWFREARRLGVKERLLSAVLLQRRLHETNRSRTHAAESRLEFLRALKAGLDATRGVA